MSVISVQECLIMTHSTSSQNNPMRMGVSKHFREAPAMWSLGETGILPHPGHVHIIISIFCERMFGKALLG